MKVSMSRDFTGHLNSAESSEEKDGRKNVFVLGDSEWGISKQHSAKVRNFPGATTERINEEIDDILPSEPDLIIIHAGTNDLATKINAFNNELSDNSNIAENHLGMKELVLNSKGNTAFAKNLINFIENWNENLENLNFIEKPSSAENSSTDCKSESPVSRGSDENKSLRQFCKLYPHKHKIAHININSLRNKLDLLSDQVKGNVDILTKLKLMKAFR